MVRPPAPSPLDDLLSRADDLADLLAQLARETQWAMLAAAATRAHLLVLAARALRDERGRVA